MEIQDIMDYLKKSSETAEKRYEASERKMEGILEKMNQKKENAEDRSVSPSAWSDRREDLQLEQPNFRHHARRQAEEKSGNSFFKRRLSSETFMNTPAEGSNIVRSIANIDPQRSGVLQSRQAHHQEQNQKFHDASHASKHNRAKMNSSDVKTGMNSVTKSFNSNNFSNDDNHDSSDEIHDIDEVFGGRNNFIEGNNPGSDITNNLSLIDKETAVRSTVNIDPEKIFDDLCHAELEEKCDNADSDINKSGMNSYVKPYISNNFNNKNESNAHDYNDDDKQYDDAYDLCEIYGNRNENIEVLNTGSNLTNNLSLIDRNDSDLPCHAEGTSLYTSNSSQNPPQILRRDTSLRDIDIVEEEQVSVFSIDNANNTSHSNIYRGGLYIPKSPVSEMQSSRDSRGNKIAVISIRILQFVSLIKVYDPGKYCTSICIHFPYFNSTIKIALLL
jgi:hypothetical protein